MVISRKVKAAHREREGKAKKKKEREPKAIPAGSVIPGTPSKNRANPARKNRAKPSVG